VPRTADASKIQENISTAPTLALSAEDLVPRPFIATPDPEPLFRAWHCDIKLVSTIVETAVSTLKFQL
jgi:hypothetical protein